MNSYNTDVYFLALNYYNLQSVHFEYKIDGPILYQRFLFINITLSSNAVYKRQTMHFH